MADFGISIMSRILHLFIVDLGAERPLANAADAQWNIVVNKLEWRSVALHSFEWPRENSEADCLIIIQHQDESELFAEPRIAIVNSWWKFLGAEVIEDSR